MTQALLPRIVRAMAELRFRSAQQPGGVNFTRHRSCQRLCRFETAKSTTYALTPPGPALCELYFTSPKTSHTKTCIKSALCEVCAVCEVLEPRLVFTSPPPVPTSAVVPMGPSRDSLRSNFLFLSKTSHTSHTSHNAVKSTLSCV